MKALLEFTLPEDEDAYRMAIQAPEAFCVIREMSEWLRGKVKYEEMPEEVRAAVDEARGQLFALLQDHGVTLD